MAVAVVLVGVVEVVSVVMVVGDVVCEKVAVVEAVLVAVDVALWCL